MQPRTGSSTCSCAGPVGDYIGAHALVSGMPNVKWLLGNRGYDADWFREAVQGTDPKASKARTWATIPIAPKAARALLLVRFVAAGSQASSSHKPWTRTKRSFPAQDRMSALQALQEVVCSSEDAARHGPVLTPSRRISFKLSPCRTEMSPVDSSTTARTSLRSKTLASRSFAMTSLREVRVRNSEAS